MCENVNIVEQLLQQRNFGAIAGCLDELELESPAGQALIQWPHVAHLLAHIYNFSLADARLLYKRVPDAARKGNRDLEAAFALLQQLWVRNYEGAWAALAYPWPADLRPLVDAFAEKLRAHMLALVMRAYVNISPAKLGTLLGMTPQSASDAAVSQGWEVDAENGLLNIVRPSAEPNTARATQASLQHLSDYVVHLET